MRWDDRNPPALTLHFCRPSSVKSHLTWQWQGGEVIIHKGFFELWFILLFAWLKCSQVESFFTFSFLSLCLPCSLSLPLPAANEFLHLFVVVFFLAASVYVCDKYVLEIRAQYLQVVCFGFLRLPVIFALWLWWVSFLCAALLSSFSVSPSLYTCFYFVWCPMFGGCT